MSTSHLQQIKDTA
ncbi:hypothetical protein KIPB_016009, partial [Kipferlia bialata]|eukprot:g16009.t1